MVRYDYSTADPALGIDDRSRPSSDVFIQGYGGLATYLEFSKESFDNIRENARVRGYSRIAVNSAVLEIHTPERDIEKLDRAFGKLGMYFDYEAKTPEAIPDYTYQVDNSRYGGTYNGTHYMYRMDITAYAQLMFNGNYKRRGVVLAPAVEEMISVDNVRLGGYGSDNPIELTVTYTMIR